MNGNGNGNGKSVVGNIADFGNDVFTLAELQAKLAAADINEAKSRVITTSLMMAVAIVIAVGAVPVGLFGIAELLAAAVSIRLGLALMITAGVALLLTGIACWSLLPRLTRSLAPLRRSREEFTRNLDWIRTVLVHSGRSIPRP